ncbi:succinate dehydrogenase, cytochrome b subunit [Deferribacter desulfuricans SSM1]|uniref:Succinate dehydrogenase, cytochrome b subunit n=2 Tax=Deferribacter TaxID=53572 RepID=D3PC45_DEFDS|nr:succinate dehydrogenase, cytochrome b subunit [Deferribacter desulfuricans SSM1]
MYPKIKKGCKMPRKDLITYPKKVSYRKHTGMTAWLLHRITGVILGLYLIFHILGKAGVAEWFTSLTANAGVRAVVFLTFIYHAFNGFRIVLIDFSNGAEKGVFAKQFMVVIFLVIVVFIIGAIPIFS